MAFDRSETTSTDKLCQRFAKLKEVQPTAQIQRIAPHLILLQRSQAHPPPQHFLTGISTKNFGNRNIMIKFAKIVKVKISRR